MAIEDIIWAKNRHMFGGIEPDEVRTFKAGNIPEEENSENNFRIAIEIPKDTVINNQTICTVAGVVVKGKLNSPPVDEFDGDLIGDYTESGTYDVLIPGVTEDSPYYLSAFSYSDQGVFNKTAKSISAGGTLSSGSYLFGYDLDTTNEDPYERVTYPDDVDNASYTPAVLNDLKSWNLISPGEKFMPRPCMLKYDGTVGYFLNSNDYSLQEDGSASDVANTSYGGNAMMEWPKIYTCRWEEDGIYHFRCSDAPQDDGHDWYCWCNYDENDEEIDHFYTGIYNSTPVGTYATYRSLSGTSAQTNIYGSDEERHSRANGAGWDVEYLADHFLIQDLLVMMGKSTDTQTVYGVGATRSVSSGSLNSRGLFYGDTTGGPIKIFGMEEYWGYLSRRVHGLFWDAAAIHIKITKGVLDGSSTKDFTWSNGCSGYVLCNSYTGTSYIKSMVTYPWGRLPASSGGSSTTYECDEALSYGRVGNTNMLAAIGGAHDNQTIAAKGVYCYDFRFDYSSKNSDKTSRLSYKPTKS